MSHTQLHFQSIAREKLLAGARQLTDAVRFTLGPRSRCVLIEKKWGSPLVCNDGVTIAREVELPDPVENLSARLLRATAEKMGAAVGDGTTTATLLACAILTEGLKNLAAGASAIDLKRGLDLGLESVVKTIHSLAQPVTTQARRIQVATVSAHNDARLGQLVAEAIERVGADGVVTVEEAQGIETTLAFVEGMQLDRGYLSPYFITDPETLQVKLTNPAILLTTRKLTTLKELVGLLEQLSQAARPLLVIAEDVEGEALATLVVNKIRGVLSVAAIRAPGYGDRRRALMEDLAILTGGRLVSDELGMSLENLTLSELGQADSVVIDRETTTLIGGHGGKAAVDTRCTELRKQLSDTQSEYDREKLRERLARLSGGVAVIRVGAPSEVELKSRKEAVDDAINATQAALAEGVVPGAGLCLLRAIDSLARQEPECEGDARTGLRILQKALEMPTRTIAENSGADGGVVVAEMRKGTGAFGFDAARNTFVDLLEAGIIDPAKVVRLAVENAVSVAGVLLLTEATLTTVPEEPHIREPADESL